MAWEEDAHLTYLFAARYPGDGDFTFCYANCSTGCASDRSRECPDRKSMVFNAIFVASNQFAGYIVDYWHSSQVAFRAYPKT